MATLRILVPDEITNYIENPAFRYVTTGWEAVGSALTRVLTEARFNVASCQVVTTGAALYEGMYYRVTRLSGISSPLTASAYVRGTGTARIRLIDNPTGAEWASKNIRLRSDRWQRISVSGKCSGSDDVRVYIETSVQAQAVTFYVDGIQLERHPYETSYCDGDQEGCMWNVMDHNSLSTRDGKTRAGGRWVSLAGCERDDPDIFFTVVGGLGVAPVRNNTQSYANSPGSYHQNSKTLDRVVTLNFTVNKTDMRRKLDGSLRKLHQLRQKLFDIIKPDKTRGGEEFLVEYQDGTYPLYFKARYDGGMEGEWDIRNRWINSFPVRLLVVSPYLTEDTQEATALGIKETATVNYVMQRVDGAWSEMNGGVNAEVLDMAIGSQGEIIIVGNFILANHKATAIDPDIFANYIAYWDGRQWRGYGIGANNIINAVAVAPNGDVIVTGAFTNIGGVACNRIARWVKATSTWTALGTGLADGAGFDVAVAPNGDIYVVGSFTTAGGQLVHYCARYDGTWHSMGTDPGLNNYAYAIAISTNGTQVFIGGSFTDEWNNVANITAERIAEYDPEANAFLDVGEGFDDTVRCLVYAASGRLYATGDFSEGATSAEPLEKIAYWNGAQWYDMMGGADGIVRGISVLPTGEAIIFGDFSILGNLSADYIGLWNGTTWASLDVGMTTPVYAAIFDKNGNIFSGAGITADHSSRVTIKNIGTAEVSPFIHVVGPGTLRWIENQTTKNRVYINLEIFDEEDVFFYFGEAKIVSAVRGDLSYSILGGSDILAFKLLPKDNVISTMMTNDVGATMNIYYIPRHWSADATQHGDEL